MDSVSSHSFSFPFSAQRVLVAVPHPDDETAFAGALIRRSMQLGHLVRVVTLTKGEKSTLRYGLHSNADLASTRTAEFTQAMQLFGVAEHHMYDIPDGEVESNSTQTRRIVQKELESFQPDLLLTLEPWGIYGHPDHIALSHISTKLAGDSNVKLGYLTVTPGYIQTDSIHMAKDPTAVEPIAPHIELRLTMQDIYLKLKALRAHRSQFSLTPGFLYNWYRRKLLTHEYIHYAN